MSQIAPSSARQRCLPERLPAGASCGPAGHSKLSTLPSRRSTPCGEGQPPLGKPFGFRQGGPHVIDRVRGQSLEADDSPSTVRPRVARSLGSNCPRPPATLWYLRALPQVSDRQIAHTDARTSAITDHAPAYKNRDLRQPALQCDRWAGDMPQIRSGRACRPIGRRNLDSRRSDWQLLDTPPA